MKKSAFFLLALLLLAGCGSTEKSGAAEPAAESTSPELPLVSAETGESSSSGDRLKLLEEYFQPGTYSRGYVSENEAFLSFSNSLFTEIISGDTISLHYTLAEPASLGFSETEPGFSESFPTEEGNAEISQKSCAALETLHSFDYTGLSPEYRLTYDILEPYLERSIELTDYTYFYEPFSPVMGIQAELPTSLSDYSFRSKKDIENYLGLLEKLPLYFDHAMAYEEERIANEKAMPLSSMQEVSAFCRDFTKDGEENILITSFEDRITSLSAGILNAAAKEEYLKRNNELVTSEIFAAYNKLADFLDSINAASKYAAPLCSYENGKEYYRLELEDLLGTDRSPEEYLSLMKDRLKEKLARFDELIENDDDLLDSLDQIPAETRSPQEILEELKAASKASFPELSVTPSVTFKYVSDSMSEVSPPAYYMLPALDALEENTIYINSDSLSASDLFVTMAHEGYPGHLYQNVYSSAKYSEPLRRVLNYVGSSEGWGLYAELLAYEWDSRYKDAHSDMPEFLALNSEISLGVYAVLDLGIHYEGWSYKKVVDFIDDYFGTQDTSVYQNIYYTILSEPGYYFKYYAGYLEIILLREEAEEALGNAFSLKEFHTFYLELGSCPFSVTRKYLEAWILTRK